MPVTVQGTKPQQPAVNPFEPLLQVIDLDSYEYLSETSPFYVEAIEFALAHGQTPAEIGRFVVSNTSQRRDIGLVCEQAARHLQRKQGSQ